MGGSRGASDRLNWRLGLVAGYCASGGEFVGRRALALPSVSVLYQELYRLVDVFYSTHRSAVMP